MQGRLSRVLSRRDLFFKARRKLKFNQMFAITRELKSRSVDLGVLYALEMFGGTGELHTIDYASQVAGLEVWEIDPALGPKLHKNLPNATVKIVDSYMEVGLTENKFDLVVADPPFSMFNEYCEHFDLFPSIFRILNTSAILIINVRPRIIEITRYSDEHFKRRQSFYQTEDPWTISLEHMLETYGSLARQNCFEIKWWFTKDRVFMYPLRKHIVDHMCYLVLALDKQKDV